jgi:hypothetical protein
MKQANKVKTKENRARVLPLKLNQKLRDGQSTAK